MLADPPASPRLTDYMRYRITLELANKGVIRLANSWPALSDGGATAPDIIERLVNNILSGPAIERNRESTPTRT